MAFGAVYLRHPGCHCLLCRPLRTLRVFELKSVSVRNVSEQYKLMQRSDTKRISHAIKTIRQITIDLTINFQDETQE
jgi:hypothetical protein